jgi:peptidyl-prolyl cis-trans isomerase SurA
MKRILSVFLLAFFVAATAFSQNKKDILLTIDGSPVYDNEFIRVYQKNLDLVQDESQKDIDGYLDLFIDYKLKITEAKAQHLDDAANYKSEFNQYRDQLSRNYLFEDQITEELAKEAYERGKEEIDASHILVTVGFDAMPQDTLIAYKKIKSIHEKAIKGADFDQLARDFSEEPNAKETAGHLGYFTVFSMVYPFETEAYNTEVGKVSNIVRSQFGYHIIKVKDRRKRLPKIIVSHIMISENKGARTFDPKERINEIATMLKQGQSFESLAKEYSDDKSSAVKGGQLIPFTKGDLRSPEFEDAAYELKNIGDISAPIKTDFGWHIIRLDEVMEEDSFEKQKQSLEKRVSQGDRAKVVTYAVNKKIKDKYKFKAGADFLPYFDTYVSDTVLSRKWKMEPIPANENKVLFTIGNNKVMFSDFAQYIEVRQQKSKPYQQKDALLIGFYDEFETGELKEYFKNQLEKENDTYAAILNEYRDGLLIFDVMEHNIWKKAKNDTLGLQAYFLKNQQNYKWKQRIDAEVFSATSQITAQRVQKMLEDGKAAEEIKIELNPQGEVNVILSQGAFEVGESDLPENLEIKNGISKIYPSNGSFTVVNVKEILPPGLKSLDDVKGKVISSYQNELETQWMDNLRSKYTVEVNKRTLKRVKRKLK